MARPTRSSTSEAQSSGDRPIRILLVDAHEKRRRAYRDAVEVAGFGEPDIAASGDEALDVLGAQAQRFDVVAAWMPLPDADAVDLAGVLRRNRSPVRLILVTSQQPRDYPRAGRLAGICGADSTGTERGFIKLVRAVMADDHTTVADIVSGQSVPRTLTDDWAQRVYGVPSGARFHVKLD